MTLRFRTSLSRSICQTSGDVLKQSRNSQAIENAVFAVICLVVIKEITWHLKCFKNSYLFNPLVTSVLLKRRQKKLDVKNPVQY